MKSLLSFLLILPLTLAAQKRPRELGIKIGVLPTGALNAITDVIGATWNRPIRRIQEGFGAFVPVASVDVTPAAATILISGSVPGHNGSIVLIQK